MILGPRLGADGEGLTLRQAAAKVQDAIDLAELVAQRAPAGAPIVAALQDARAAKSWIEGQIPWFGGDPPAPLAVTERADQVESSVYDAAAQLRDPGDTPTIYTRPAEAPWGWIGASLAVVAGAFFLFRGRRRRAA